MEVKASDVTIKLCEAAANNDVDAVNECLKQKGVDINKCITVGNWTYPALSHALTKYGVTPDSPEEAQQLQVVQLLIQHGADPNTRGERGFGAVHCAQTPKVAKALLKAKANIDAVTVGNFTPLMLATSGGRVDAVRVLLEHGANTEIRNINGETALEVDEFVDGSKQCKDLIRAHIAKNKTSTVAAVATAKPTPTPTSTTTTSTPTQSPNPASTAAAAPALSEDVLSRIRAEAEAKARAEVEAKVRAEMQQAEKEKEKQREKELAALKAKAEQAEKAKAKAEEDKKKAERDKEEAEKRAEEALLAIESKGESKVKPLPALSAAEEVKLLSTATATLTTIAEEDDEFWVVVKEFKAALNNAIEDYNSLREKRGQEPLTFVISAMQKVANSVLESRYERCRQRLLAAGLSAAEMRERVGFHGTRAPNIKKICDKGLLRVGHPLNPSERIDDGYFGVPTAGVYLSRHPDYCLKYSNQLAPLAEDRECKILMFKLLPGRSRHIEKRTPGLKPSDSPDYDSHSSSNFQEWYLFAEEQCCPTHVLTVRAIINRRTTGDDD